MQHVLKIFIMHIIALLLKSRHFKKIIHHILKLTCRIDYLFIYLHYINYNVRVKMDLTVMKRISEWKKSQKHGKKKRIPCIMHITLFFPIIHRTFFLLLLHYRKQIWGLKWFRKRTSQKNKSKAKQNYKTLSLHFLSSPVFSIQFVFHSEHNHHL